MQINETILATKSNNIDLSNPSIPSILQTMKRQIELLCSIECVFETEIYALYRLKEREGERERPGFFLYMRGRENCKLMR
jgi:hypothetical protein